MAGRVNRSGSLDEALPPGACPPPTAVTICRRYHIVQDVQTLPWPCFRPGWLSSHQGTDPCGGPACSPDTPYYYCYLIPQCSSLRLTRLPNIICYLRHLWTFSCPLAYNCVFGVCLFTCITLSALAPGLGAGCRFWFIPCLPYLSTDDQPCSWRTLWPKSQS